MARGALLALLFAVPALAGCLTATLPSPPILSPGLLANEAVVDAFYEFHHAGGVLSLGTSPGGKAQTELFDPHDERLGQLLLGGIVGHVGPIEINDLPAGDYVLRLTTLNGTFIATSGGHETILWPLSSHLERHTLTQQSRNTLPVIPFNPISPAPTTLALDVRLLRAPTSLRLLATGSYTDVNVRLRGPSGLVFEVEASQSGGFGAVQGLQGNTIAEVPGQFHAEGVRDGHLWGNLTFSQLEGTLILEAASYSRLRPAAPTGIASAQAEPAFFYGPLPSQPARFQVGSQAHGITATNNGTDAAIIALFAATGARLGTFEVSGHAARIVPLVAGTYVAVLLAGNATLGADAAPADFELHPLEVTTQVLPSQAAGSNGNYATARQAATGGIVFDVRQTTVTSVGNGPVPGMVGCESPGWIRVLAGNETAAYWDGSSTSGAAGPHLDGSGVVIEADGMGADGCSREAAQVLSFHL